MFLVVVTMLFVIVPMVLAPVTTFIAAIAVLIAAIGVISVVFTVMGDVGIVVPVISNEVDRLAAGVVLAAMLTPISFMSRPHVKINRGWQRVTATPYGNDRRAIDKPWCRSIPNVDSAKKPRFTDVDRDSDVRTQY